MTGFNWRNDPRARAGQDFVALVLARTERGWGPVLTNQGYQRVIELSSFDDYFANPEQVDLAVIESEDVTQTVAGIAAATITHRMNGPVAVVVVRDKAVSVGSAIPIIPRFHVTDTEQRVVEAVQRGLAPKEIAEEFKVKPGTIYAHLGSLKENFGVKNLPSLYALLRGYSRASVVKGALDGLDHIATAPEVQTPSALVERRRGQRGTR